MYKPTFVILMLSLLLSACSSSTPNYKKTSNLLFQNKTLETKTIHVERDSKLCSNDSKNKQNCFTSFYINDFKVGDFYINNKAQYELKPNTYNLKIKNCNKECAVTEFKYTVQKDRINPKIILSIDQNGLPLMIQEGIIQTQPIPPKAEKTPAPVVLETTEELSLDADTLFQFDRSNLNDLLTAGQLELDDIAMKINQKYVTVSAIELVGHTDRLGSEDYNFKLAQNRADTVRSYLVQKGIPANIITTASAGKTQPVTQGCYHVKPFMLAYNLIVVSVSKSKGFVKTNSSHPCNFLHG